MYHSPNGSSPTPSTTSSNNSDETASRLSIIATNDPSDQLELEKMLHRALKRRRVSNELIKKRKLYGAIILSMCRI